MISELSFATPENVCVHLIRSLHVSEDIFLLSSTDFSSQERHSLKVGGLGLHQLTRQKKLSGPLLLDACFFSRAAIHMPARRTWRIVPRPLSRFKRGPRSNHWKKRFKNIRVFMVQVIISSRSSISSCRLRPSFPPGCILTPVYAVLG